MQWGEKMMYRKTITKEFCRNLLFVFALVGTTSAFAANEPSMQEVLGKLGIEQEKLADLEKGETVAFDVEEKTEKEMAAGVAVYLPAPPSKLIAFVKKGDLASIDTDVVAQGMIPAGASQDAFKGFGFSAKQKKEAENFLSAEPGDEFNLSTEEINAIKALKADDAKAPSDVASQAYRNVLMQRVETYRKNGLAGIAPYSRDGEAADPAAELRNATVNSKLLASYFPELQKAWLNYPAALPSGTEEAFFGLNRKVEKRPTPILGHRVLLTTGSGAVILARQFYVGHSYNSNQLSVICLPHRDGSLVFYANRTSTDQIAGMGSSLKHSIGREQMQAEIVKRLKNLRKLLKS